MTSRSRRWAKLHSTAKRSQKFEKPLQLAFSISEATARNFCYHESWAMQVHPLSPKKTKSVPPLQHSKMSSQSNKSSLRQFLSERILTCLKAAHLTSTFSVVISRRSQGWIRTDRWRHKQALLTLQLHFWSLFINCCFNHKLFHWACMKSFVFIHWRSL